MSISKSSIEWTDSTWNPVRGCSRVSDGCRQCYAEKQALRFSGKGQPFEGLVTLKTKETVLRRDFANGNVELKKVTKSLGARWTGVVKLIENQLSVPLRWKKGRRIFVNSMSDLFHESLTFEEIDRVFAVMAACPQHQFQILTKRPKRMAEYLNDPSTDDRVAMAGERLAAEQGWCHAHEDEYWPLPNVWLGVSVENQKEAERRIPYLLDVPAAVRFLSCEPLLGPIDFGMDPDATTNPRGLLACISCRGHGFHTRSTFPDVSGNEQLSNCPECRDGIVLHWVIAGAESGPGARPMNEDWVRSLRDQCTAAGIPFFYKQKLDGKNKIPLPLLDGKQWAQFPETG